VTLAIAAATLVTLSLFAQARSVWDGVYSADQADRGRRLYARDCAQCHGSTLMGAEGGAELVGEAILTRWQRDRKSVGGLYELIRKTMPEAAPGSLSDRQYLDILAYLLKENGFPVGRDDLPPARETLDAIAFAKP
jgi:mono/diheme cytochrome c family protein